MVIWSDPARADLQSIQDVIAHDSRHFAKKVTQDIVTKTDVLDELPHMGRMVLEFGDEIIHELSIYSYSVLYEIKDEDTFAA